MDMLEAALSYASRGWRVFPTHSISNGACTCGKPTCGSAGKHPIFNNWQHHATTEAGQIQLWWQTMPWANVAIATGSRSGLVVLDVDVSPTKDGLASLDALERQYGKLPATLKVRTGSGGYHFYFSMQSGQLKNSVGLLGEGIDTRGEGGYVVAPPSLHISGNRYSVENTNV